jgi:hypothetical protein
MRWGQTDRERESKRGGGGGRLGGRGGRGGRDVAFSL